MTTPAPRQPIQRKEFQAQYDKCMPDEREMLRVELLKMIDLLRQSSLAFFMANPKYLGNLPQSKLWEVTEMELEDANTWMLENAPQTREILYPLEVLTIFSMSNEPTAADLRDVITSLEEVWKATDEKYAEDMPTSNINTLPGSKGESTPARANRFSQLKDCQSLHPDTHYAENPRRKSSLHAQEDHPKPVSKETKGRQA